MSVKFEKYLKEQLGFTDADLEKQEVSDELGTDYRYTNKHVQDLNKIWVYQVARMMSIYLHEYDPLGPLRDPTKTFG